MSNNGRASSHAVLRGATNGERRKIPESRRGRAAASLLPARGVWSRTRTTLLDRYNRAPGNIVPEGNRSLGYRLVKRLMDVVGALVLIALLWPLLLATWLVLFVTTRGRPIFSQERVGYCGRRFRLYKFRTMVLDAERLKAVTPNEQRGPIFKNRRDPRVTRIGRFLRVWTIDELPQLFNVLKGDMSLVGPRPPVPIEVAHYQPGEQRRLSVKPGLTCLWQVSGRSEVGFAEWVRMDVWYVERQSLRLDLKLLWKTPFAVLSRRGAF